MNLAESLRDSAEALEKRLRVLMVPRTNLHASVWNEYDARFPGVVPSWYKELLRDYAFAEVSLSFRITKAHHGGACARSLAKGHEDAEWLTGTLLNIRGN